MGRAARRVAYIATCGVLASCGGPSSHGSRSASRTASTSGGTTSGSVSIPITIATGAGPQGGPRLIVRVSVGGGPSVPVILDTGSGGLYLLPGAVGPHVTRSGQSNTTVYEGWQQTSAATRGSFSIGGVSAPQPVTFGTITSVTPAQHFAQFGVEGIMGVGKVSPSASALGIFSALAQLSGPSWQGFTLDLPAPGGPRLLLGRPARSSASLTLPLRSAGARYPNGSPAYDGILPLCWKVGGSRACGPTLPDTGSPNGFVSAIEISNVPTVGHKIAPGTPVTISAPPPSSTVLESFTTAAAPVGFDPGYGNRPLFSAGLELYYKNRIGFDLVSGQAVITPGG